MAHHDIPSSALDQAYTEDVFADLDSLSRRVRAELFNADPETDTRTLFPAQFVKDLDALLSEWFSPIMDAR